MANKCYTMEAKNFENKLNELGITYKQYLQLDIMHRELTQAGKIEVANLLSDTEEKNNDKRS